MRPTYEHRGIKFSVTEGHEDGLYLFSFDVAGRIVRGHTRTRLIGVAVRRVKDRINRELRLAGRVPAPH